MDREKKVLILFASAGHGHEKAAKAIGEAYQELAPGTLAGSFDTLEIIPPFWGHLYRKVYYTQIKYLPWLWGFFYFGMDIPLVYALMRRLRRFINGTAGRPLQRFIQKEHPSVIISTHFLATEIVSFLKSKGWIKSRLITVVTDYLPHHFWTAAEVDSYVVALPETKIGLVKLGIPAEKIEVLGIPVEKKFLTGLSLEEARSKLSLDLSAFTILITSGGAGIGAMENMVKKLLELNKPVQILAVCGTNQNLFEHLEQRAQKQPLLKVYGFVNNMNELMAACDVVIGKGGGLTITESFSQGKPIILFDSIPGQETRNADCVKKYGAGFIAGSLDEIARQISMLAESPQQLESMRQGVLRMSKPDAAKKISQLVSRYTT